MSGMESSARRASGLNSAVAAEIRAELARRQWTQVELAAKLGEDQMWLSRRLRAAKPLTLTEFEAICLALSITPAELLGRALRVGQQPTPGYSHPPVRPTDNRPKGGPGAQFRTGPPNGALPVRHSRHRGTPLAVANYSHEASGSTHE